MTKILLTGAYGQVGSAIQSQFKTHELICTDHIEGPNKNVHTLDLTNTDQVDALCQKTLPEIIINTAAYTAVDKAESNKEAAFLVNERAVGYLAEVCKMSAITLLHISTDYVFNGAATTPYKETDITNPETVYGASKLAGERIIQEIAPEHFFMV